MTILPPLATFVFLTVVICVFGYRTYVRPMRRIERISQEPARNGIGAAQSTHGYEIKTALQWVGEKLPQSPREMSITRRMLSAAGLRSDAIVAVYAGARVVATVLAGCGAFIILQHTSLAPFFRIVGAAVGAFAGFMGPSLALDEMVKARKDRLRTALPDALDLMVVCVESGLGLDQAIRVVSDELAIAHPDISKELSLVSLEMRAGVRRATALRNLADRTGEQEMRKLTAVLIQTDRFGTSLADSLRTHADFVRVRRRHEAEEKAGKIGVKLTIPIFFFILPSIMVVTAGPAALRLFKELLPAIQQPGAGQ